MKELTKENIADVVLKLIGDVQPVGSTHIDNKKYENLEVMGEVFYRLFRELSEVEYDSRNRVQASMKGASKKAQKIIIDTLEDYLYDRGYRKAEKDLWYGEEER